MRNPEQVIIRYEVDTSYTNICPNCIARTGSGGVGPRILSMILCDPCAVKRNGDKKKPMRLQKHLRAGVLR
jgi:hypothetical protein